MHGDLTVGSNAGGGASFTLVLPKGATDRLADVRTSGETAASRSA
jgi:hypothetical protein